MGILTSNNARSVVTIIDSGFSDNTADYQRYGRLGHGIYIGRVRAFVLIGNRIRGAETGHQVKSRARRNEIIGNSIRDDRGSSYLIDLPDGGEALISDNDLYQGERAQNRTAIAFASEGNHHATHGTSLEVGDNRFRNDGPRGTFVRNHSEIPARLLRNELSGQVTPLRGPGFVDSVQIGTAQIDETSRLSCPGSSSPSSGRWREGSHTSDGQPARSRRA